MISREKLIEEAGSAGFRPEILEKVIRLLDLLNGFNEHPALKDRFVLKGGTALNLFIFDIPRLSVDIDLNYIGAVDRKDMEVDRPKIEQGIEAVCNRGSYSIHRTPSEHAGGKWRLSFQSSLGNNSNLELDVNFILRVPLWDNVRMDSRKVGGFQASNISVLDIHELTAGKVAALLARRASRDLFDVHQILTKEKLDQEKLRLAFLVYAGINRIDFRKVSVESINFDQSELKNQLFPVLRSASILKGEEFKGWAEKINEECKELLGIILPYKDNELEFLDRLLDDGEIKSDLLTSSEELTEKIRLNPALRWKALNVAQFKG